MNKHSNITVIYNSVRLYSAVAEFKLVSIEGFDREI